MKLVLVLVLCLFVGCGNTGGLLEIEEKPDAGAADALVDGDAAMGGEEG